MLEIGKVNAAAPVHAEGRVTLEYTDGLTGRVKERVQGKNHVFPGGMMLGGLPYLLGNNSTGNPLAIYLSDYEGALDMEIPLIPGNIIGYGKVGSAATGAYLGTENTSARSLGVYSAGKFHYKRQWSWIPSQVPGVIRKIGLSPRLTGGNRSEYNNILFSPFPIALPDGGTGFWDYDNQRYSILRSYQYNPNETIVRQYTFGNSTATNIKWSQLVTIDDYYSTNGCGTLCWFLDRTSRDLHLFFAYLSSEISGGKRLNKLLHAWFDGGLSQRKGLETTVLGTQSNDNWFDNNYIVMFGLLSGGVYFLPYKLDGSAFSWCSFNPGAAVDGDFSACFTKAGELLLDGSYSAVPPNGIGANSGISILGNRVSMSLARNSMSHVFQFKPGSEQIYAVKVISCSGSYASIPFGLLPRSLSETDVLAAYNPPKEAGDVYADTDEKWINFSDLCCYSLPADAPARQEGQGVSVTYELAVGY